MGQILYDMLTDSDYTKVNYNVNIILKSFEWRIQFLQNNASYNIISELNTKSDDTTCCLFP